MSARRAFPDLCRSTNAHAVSIELTDAGLVAEPWEAIEIDESVTLAVETKVVRSWRSMLAAYRLRHGLT
jgi:hypothetical protein